MSDGSLVFFCTFSAVVLLGYFVSLLQAKPETKQLRNRLSGDARPIRQKPAGIMPLLRRLGLAAAEPFMPKTRERQSGLRHSLARAGLYSPAALRLMTGCKVIFLCAGVVGGYLFGVASDMMLLGLSLGGIAGYLLPTMWLRLQIKANQRALTHGLADALDLMVVCVEAGLTVDSAM